MSPVGRRNNGEYTPAYGSRGCQKHVAHLAATAIVSLTEAKLGIHDIRHYVHSRVLRYLGHVFRMDADRTPSLLQRCWVVPVDGKQRARYTDL